MNMNLAGRDLLSAGEDRCKGTDNKNRENRTDSNSKRFFSHGNPSSQRALLLA